MSEIGLRAYDTLRKEYLSAGQIILAIQAGRNPETIQYLDILKSPNAYKNRFIIEQYRGQKDKTGQKIFDGDLLNVIDGLGNELINKRVSYKSEWGRVIVGDNLTLTYNIACKSKITGTIHDGDRNV